MSPPSALFAGVRLLVLDVDGVLTDGRVSLDERGVERRSFHVPDGAGLVYLRRAGVPTALVSGRASRVVDYRAQELGIDAVVQGTHEKGEAVEALARRFGVELEAVAFVGDDLLDLPAFERAGVPVAVANACEELRRRAHYVTRARGGEGAVREVAELILRSRGAWEAVVARGGRP